MVPIIIEIRNINHVDGSNKKTSPSPNRVNKVIEGISNTMVFDNLYASDGTLICSDGG